MIQELLIRIVLETPPIGVDFGIQKGKGSQYETIQRQRSGKDNLYFTFCISVKDNKSLLPDFAGPYVQGPINERFIYIGVGTHAGQMDSCWSRRLKIPLRDISHEDIRLIMEDSSLLLETKVPGTGKDGSPNCATVKPFPGWHIAPIK